MRLLSPLRKGIQGVQFTRTVERQAPDSPARSPHLRLLPLARRCLQPWPHARSGARYVLSTLELAMRLASRSPSATRSGSRRWPTRARSVVVHLLFNVFAPVGEGPAQRAQAAHATRRASKVGSVHAAERTAETTPSPTALERSWFWGRAASLPACAPCGAPCMLRAVCVSGVEAGALERVEGRASAHGWAPPPARAGGPGVPTREASVERSFKSASLCRVENLCYHSLITILTDTGRRPLSHGNCPWRSPTVILY